MSEFQVRTLLRFYLPFLVFIERRVLRPTRLSCPNEIRGNFNLAESSQGSQTHRMATTHMASYEDDRNKIQINKWRRKQSLKGKRLASKQ